MFLSWIALYFPPPANVREDNLGFKVGGKGGWHEASVQDAQAMAWYRLCWLASVAAIPLLVFGQLLVRAGRPGRGV
ncbi:MAG: hypothetical protein L0215_16280 [Gemmataceae bacterium]|nr:hypothetical protein [Gemmataceae bacterium]